MELVCVCFLQAMIGILIFLYLLLLWQTAKSVNIYFSTRVAVQLRCNSFEFAVDGRLSFMNMPRSDIRHYLGVMDHVSFLQL